MAAKEYIRFANAKVISSNAKFTIEDVADWLIAALSGGDIQGYALDVQRRAEEMKAAQ
jgi:hypothetical protein